MIEREECDVKEQESALAETHWAIDLNWLNNKGRSFSTLAGDALCAKCRKKLKIDANEVKPADLLKATQSCCSKSPDFITSSLPIQASIFRVFLANGNKPLTLEQLGEQLSQRRGIDTYRASPGVLLRLINSDQYYGVKSK